MANHTDAIRLAEGIKSILDDEAFKAAVSLAQARIFNEWTTAADFQSREELHAEMKALDRLLESFEELINEGMLASIATKGNAQ